MAKHRRNSVIVLEQAMVKSAVWIGLGATAKAVFLLFRCKCRWENYQGKKGKNRVPDLANNGEIVFTYDEALEKYGISDKRFTRALDELIGKGFIDVAATGAGTFKATTFYSMSQRWRLHGTPDFVEKKRPRRSKGYPGFKKGNQLWKRRQKRISTDENIGGATDESVGGSVIAMYTNIGGEKVKELYEHNGHNWICVKIA